MVKLDARIYIGTLLLLFAVVMSGCTQLGNPSVTPTPTVSQVPLPTTIPPISPTPIPSVFPDANKVWVTINPIQCNENPWEQYRVAARTYPSGKEMQDDLKNNEELIIKEYFKNFGITVYEFKKTLISEMVCLACSCSNGYKIEILVDRQFAKLIDGKGNVLSDYVLVANSSYQCGEYGNETAFVQLRSQTELFVSARFASNCEDYSVSWKIVPQLAPIGEISPSSGVLEINFEANRSNRACMKCLGMDSVTTTIDLTKIKDLGIVKKLVINKNGKFISEKVFEGSFCGGIAAFQCPLEYACVFDGTYPDAGGKCIPV
ncbi:hypothetical protein HY989_05010 [Candidatus Micrarchaeota archaeon]|nr:hypothetical protein [Candidatus Micrarchaeota archaeon]